MARPIIEAGAIAVRLHGGEPEFLLVTAKRNAHAWIFPKGHFEKGESAEACALRELREEAGVIGDIVAPIGLLTFISGSDRIEVNYFLVRALDEEAAEEGRQLRWLPYDRARAQLTYENARELLDRAHDLVERR